MSKNVPTKLLLAVLLCLTAHARGFAQAGAGKQEKKQKTKVETNYDESKGETTARIGPLELFKPPKNSVSGEMDYEQVDMTVAFSYPGKRIAKPKSVTLMVFAASERGARFEKRRDLSIKTDSGTYDLGEMELVGKGEGHLPKRIGGAGVFVVREIVRKSIPFDEFASIAKSERAEMKIGSRKFKLEKSQLVAFRNFVSLMEQEGLEF
ncbi:MAG TPA: hypothetical protein VD861_20960 [Pyrinomonadaceae bacterium]|nr:hypothetical protein [Pyrinomonadaceae bacterium]